jgi:hypothetical protein
LRGQDSRFSSEAGRSKGVRIGTFHSLVVTRELEMKALRYGALTIVVAFCGFSQAQSVHNENPGSAREKLIGAWHLAHIEAPGPDGKPMDIPQPKGMLIYTLDGHMSVQLMYPKSGKCSYPMSTSRMDTRLRSGAMT